MKSKLNRILLLLIALLLTICLSATVVSAKDADTASDSWVHPLEAVTAAQETDSGEATSSAGELPKPSYYYPTMEAFAEAMRQQFEARTNTFTLGFIWSSNYTWDDVEIRVAEEMFRHTGVPTQGDYIRENTKRWSWKGERELSSDGKNYYYVMAFENTYRSTAAQEQEVNAAVKALLKQLNLDGYSDYAKARVVYDWMCSNITYDHDGLAAGREICHATYSAIVLRDTVCQGYASLFYRLMLELDVDCRHIGGDSNTYGETGPNYPVGVGDNHSWNIVKVDGKWYNLDATWDAGNYEDGYGITHDWFLVSNANFPRHYPWSEQHPATFWAQYPISTTNYSYTTSPNGWYVKGGKWHFGQNGFDRAGWLQQGNTWYYLDQNGVMKTGWVLVGNQWYFMNPSGDMKTGWLQQGNTWYYLKSSGAMATGSVIIDGKLNQFASNGVWLGTTALKGWVQDDGKWYYYNANGTMATGWLQISGKWYFFDGNGVMKTGWLQQGRTWYYFNTSGVMATGWQQAGGSWYFFNGSGAMVTGWLQQGGKWYYFGSSGAMATGWLQSGRTWYYFKADGAMATGWLQIGGTHYFFQSSGAMVTGWLQSGGEWYYMDSSGAMLMQWQHIGGKIYYFDHNTGKMWHDIWIKTPDGSIYYSCSDGYIYTNGWYWINGTQHYFNADGVCSNPPALRFN